MLSFDPPSIPGLGATGGFEFQVEDLAGRGSVALNDAAQALIAEARKQPEINPQQLFSSFSTSTPQFNYDLDRNKAKLLGLEPAGRVQHAADLSRLALRQRLQPVRPHLPRHHAGRRGGARLGAATCRGSTCATPPAAWCRSSTLGTLKPIVGPETVPHYNNYAVGADQWRRRARLQLGPGGGGDGAGGGQPRCRATSATNGPASPSRSSRPARSRPSSSASPSSSCS